MNQDEINQREWNNPDNWGRVFAFYRSRLDTRVWVPKQKSWMGRTLNFGNPVGRLWALLLVLLPIALVAVVVFAVLLK